MRCGKVPAGCGNIRAAPACGNAPVSLSSRSMSFLRHLLTPFCALLLACGSDVAPPTKSPSTFTVFPNLPLPPGAKFVSRAGSSDALQITLFSPGEPTSVVEYYRDVLSKGRWRLISDQKKPDGKVVFYAEQDGPPIWVSVWPTDSAGTMVQLAGAVLAKDSAKAGAEPAPTPKSKS